jgi:hypothetical protein
VEYTASYSSLPRMLPFLFLLGSLHFYGALSSDSVYMHRDETPDPGPEEDTVYVPGTPGGSWTEEEVASTRLRILQMIYPDWDVKINMINKSIRTLRTQVFNGHESCAQYLNLYLFRAQ